MMNIFRRAGLGLLLMWGMGLTAGEIPPGGKPPLPRLVLTHAMGMMPVGAAQKPQDALWNAAGRYPYSPFALKNPQHFARGKFYGGGRMESAIFANFTRADGTYDYNQPLPQGPVTAEKFRHYRWDLEQAEAQGIDGFGLCLSGNEASYKHAANWFRTLEKMLQENPAVNIRLTMIICGDDLGARQKDPRKYAWLPRFMKEFRDSPAWLRHAGRHVIMGYKNQISWDIADSLNREFMQKIIKLHRDFLQELGLGDAYFIFDGAEYLPGQIAPAKVPGSPAQLAAVASDACRVFDGYSCWGGIIPDKIYQENYPPIAAAVRAAGKAWMMPILNIHSGVGQFYQSRPGVQRLVDTWNFAEKTGATLAQIVTWNDWRECTSFAPNTCANHALAILNSKFIYRFKHRVFPEPEEDEVFMFYRKYHSNATPRLYPPATVERDRNRWGQNDSMLHVFIFATSAGTARITGTSDGEYIDFPISRGYNEIKLETAPDREIAVRIYRGGKLAHALVSPEKVTTRPYREDLLPWGWCSHCEKIYKRDYGEKFRPLSDYSTSRDDGIPDWFRRHWWGTLDEVPGSGKFDDPDNDGKNNFVEYLLGTNPLAKTPDYPPAYRWNDLGKALARITNPQQPASSRINLNPYPDAFGNLVHGFLFGENGETMWMCKWSNQKNACGWTFRDGRKQFYSIGKRGGVRMRILPEYSGIYRFWAPIRGNYRMKATLFDENPAGQKNSAEALVLTVKDGDRELARLSCPPGGTVNGEWTRELALRAELDFVVETANGGTCELVPEITLEKGILPE